MRNKKLIKTDYTQNNIKGSLYILLAAATFPAMGALVKLISYELHPFVIAFFRSFFGLVLILPLILKENTNILKTNKLYIHLIRGILGVGAMLTGFYALSILPLASAISIGYTRVLFLIPLAVIILGEKVTILRVAATFIGFLGVLIIVGFEKIELPIFAVFLALISAFLIAAIKLTIKYLSSTESTLTIQIWFGIISTIGTVLPAILVWETPSNKNFLLLFCIGALGLIAQILTIKGLRIGQATVVMPVDYSRLIFASTYGLILFGEIPTWNTLIGAFFIIITCIYINQTQPISKSPI